MASGTVQIAIGFFLSGAAALVYQVAWQRILALHSGLGIYSVAMIVAAFMAGLGLGSQAGGILSARLTPSRALWGFIILESAIALFGASSCVLYYDWVYQKAAALYTPAWRAPFLHFLALLVPTSLMGMSLPFLVRATVLDVAQAGRTISLLYAVNVVGASAGALLTPWVLVRFLGVRGAVTAAALANATAALLAWWATRGRRVPAGEETVAAAPPPGDREAPPPHHLALWASLYTLSGFIALALEIVWFRLVDVGVKSSAFTFGTVLALYLLGSAVGAIIGISWAPRLARPLKAFLTLQSVLLAYTAAAVLALVRLPADLPLYGWFVDYWARTEGHRLGAASDPQLVAQLYLALPLALYGLPTVLMGLSFSVLQRAVHDDVRLSSRRVGLLQALNIAGCAVGGLLIGLGSLTALGTAGTLRALAIVGLVFPLLGLRHFGWRGRFGVFVPLLMLLAVLLPGQQALWSRLHGLRGERAFLGEDASGVVAIKEQLAGYWYVLVDGKGHSWVPFSGVHTWLGAMPALVHPRPVDVAIVGLGSGNTAWAAACRPQTRSVTVFEISGPQPRLLAEFAAAHGTARLQSLLADPRLRIVMADGRKALESGGARYDIIEADAQRPWSAYAGYLYSVEFFRQCARQLKPGGMMCTWAPTPRIRATFGAAFPHVVDGGEVLVGSLDAIPFDLAAWASRLEDPAVAAYLGPRQSAEVLRQLRRSRPAAAPAGAPVRLNHDLFPRDEFLSP